MKKISILSLLLVAFSSCQVEEMMTPENGNASESEANMATYYVGIDNSGETRTSLSEEGEILWSEGDRMNIFFGVNNDNKDKLVLMEGAGTKNGSFYGPYIATSDLSKLHQTVIVYPFDENNTCVANEDKTEYTVGLTIPAVQEYTEGTFAVGSYPMIGVTEGVKEVVIKTKNVISGMKLRLTGDKTIAKIVISADGLALAGPANVVASYGNAPVTTVVDATASNTVELECGDGVQLNETTPTDFYITLAPCEGKINVKIYDNEGGYMSRTTSSMNFGVNQIFNMPILTYAVDHKIEDDIEKAFKNGGEYKLPVDVAVNKFYTIQNGKTLNFDLGGHTLTLKAGPGASNASIQNNNASLHISNGEIVAAHKSHVLGTADFGPDAVLELTDVKIRSTVAQNAGGIMMITNATNIIFNNVDVDAKGTNYGIFVYYSGSVEGDYPGESGIIINGGTYKVPAGKEIFYKNRVADRKLPVIFQGDCLFSENSYTGVTWAESGNEEFPWKPVGHQVFVGAQGFYSLAEAVASVEESATVTVAADLELTETVTIPAGKTIVLDLAGNTVSQSKECTGSYSMIENNGTLTITGEGTLRFEDLSDGGSADWGSYIITNRGTLIVENGTLEHLGTSDLSNHDTCIPIQNYAGKVTVNDGIISSPEFRSLRDFTAGGEIEINGGVFKGQVWMQGLGNGSSTLTVKGGEFAPTAGYDGSSIFITNGTNDVKVSIEGGKFNTKIGCTNATKEGVAGCITGGLFTESAKDNTNAGLLKSGLAFVESGDVDFPYALDYRIFANGVGYPSIQAAIDASVGGEVIEVAAGTYPQVLKVTGGKNLTIQPKEANTLVTIGGVDHQSNGTPSTVVFNNITFDNSIQSAGWFTGTAQNIKPCVGAWGGNLSFKECTFNVAGTSGAETGVMTWWTTDKMSLSFEDCTFNGINDHAEARAMQIYGNVDLTVDGCTFNTHKRYSLKYVGKEGTEAVLTNNVVNNAQYMVEVGSSEYAGNAYEVTISGSVLGEGIEDFKIANIEEQIVNGVEYSKCLVRANGQKFETVAEALAGTTGDVEVTMKNGTYTLPTSGLAGRNITFVGESKEGTVIDMSAVTGTPQYNASSVTFKNVTMKRKVSDYGGMTHTAAEHYDNCIIEGTLVTYGTNVSVKNTAFVPAANEGYNVHIYEGGNVSFENCTFETLNCRSVYAYSETAKEMNISFNDCYFATKADATEDFRYHQAIRLHTEYGIHGTLTINRCSTDGNFNPAHNNGLWVEWNNLTKALTDNFVKMIDGVEVSNSVATVGGVSYTSLAEALANAGSGQTVAVKAGQYTALPQVNDGVVIECEEGTVFTGNSKLNINGSTIVGATFSNPSGTVVDQTINGTFKDCVFDGSNALRWCYAGETVVFEDCVFSGDVYGVHFDGGANEVLFKNCTFSGFNAMGGAIEMVTFDGCTFKANGRSGYNGINLWGSAKMINTEFTFDGSVSNEWIDCIGVDKTYEFTGCTINGKSIINKAYFGSRNEDTDITIDGVLYEDFKTITFIASEEEMVAFANEVNVNKNSFAGKYVYLTADIDLEGIDWEPVGQTGNCTFNGVFDGQNHTISNLSVDSEAETGANYSSGLFGWIESHSWDGKHGTIRNVKVVDATVNGHHNCAVIAGYLIGIVENCHVNKANVSCTVANADANGDKAGAIAGILAESNAYIRNCTATDVTVSAGRDAGQIVGAASNGWNSHVTGCTASNVTVTANGTGTGANIRNEIVGRL